MILKSFTEASVKAVYLSQEESRRLNHEQVGSETLLLGLISSGGLADIALSDSNINLKHARQQVESIIGRGRGSPEHEIPFTARAKRIFKLAWSIANEVEGNQDFLSTKHLLLAMIDEADSGIPGVGVVVLRNCGVDLAALRFKTLNLSNDLSTLDMPHGNDAPPPADQTPIDRGPWPPDSDPDDPSRVPLRPKPSDDASEDALPLPNPNECSEQ